ncbi:MAG TPA: inorganic diphosphatase [Planctomycetaceae bacterium]|nr:inorganic diphosphatase [Planctomycetaceae bacterium]
MTAHRIHCPLNGLTPVDPQKDAVRVIIETPKGSRNKFKFDAELGLFRLGSVLPAGAVFPYDFGFVPGTRADDGDPLDVLLLLDVPTFCGCLVLARLIGVIEAEQTEDGETCRNDRLVAIACKAKDYQQIESLKDLDKNLLDEIEYFFVSYNKSRGREFKLLEHRGPGHAQELLREKTVRRRRKKSSASA